MIIIMIIILVGGDRVPHGAGGRVRAIHRQELHGAGRRRHRRLHQQPASRQNDHWEHFVLITVGFLREYSTKIIKILK